jgi:adenylate cyclase
VANTLTFKLQQKKNELSDNPDPNADNVAGNGRRQSVKNNADPSHNLFEDIPIEAYIDSESILVLLKPYLDPKFLTTMDKMDKKSRLEMVKHFLILFEKIDRILALTPYRSLDVDLDLSLENIIEEAKCILQCTICHIYLIDGDTGDMVCKEYDSWLGQRERAMLPNARFPLSQGGIAGWVAQNGETVILKEAYSHEKFNPIVDIRNSGMDASSLMCVPIRMQNGLVRGAIMAVNKEVESVGHVFDNEDEFMLKSLGRQAATIIGNKEVYDHLKKSQKKVNVLLDTTRSLGSTIELDKLISLIMEAAKELLYADRCTLFLLDYSGKYLSTRINGVDFRISINSGIAGFVYTSGQSVNIQDAYKDSRWDNFFLSRLYYIYLLDFWIGLIPKLIAKRDT